MCNLKSYIHILPGQDQCEGNHAGFSTASWDDNL